MSYTYMDYQRPSRLCSFFGSQRVINSKRGRKQVIKAGSNCHLEEVVSDAGEDPLVLNDLPC